MKKTLIIHPKDSSTTFLREIYEDIPYKTVISGGLTKLEILAEIDKHDKIMMMGHGSPFGLFGVNFNADYAIDKLAAPLLKGKENYFIWCYANEFVNRHELNGFSTGMFISEKEEATYCNVDASTQDVGHSNLVFSELMRKNILKEQTELFKNVTNAYDEFAKKTKNKVAEYNNKRLILV